MQDLTEQFEPPLDAGIAEVVAVLRDNGVETFESCEGGPGHAYPEPTVRFHGDTSEGLRALAAAIKAELPVAELRRTWPIQDDEITGPWWELTFVGIPRLELTPNQHPGGRCAAISAKARVFGRKRG